MLGLVLSLGHFLFPVLLGHPLREKSMILEVKQASQLF